MRIEITEEQNAVIINHMIKIFDRIRKQEGENIAYNSMERVVSIIQDRFNIMLGEDFNTTNHIQRYKRDKHKNLVLKDVLEKNKDE